MSKVPPNIPDPKKPESIIKGVMDVARVVDGNIEFGNPQNPLDDQDDTPAGTGDPTVHNGFVQNIYGSWVEVIIGPVGGSYVDLNEPHTCTHNLNVPVAVAGEPNVRWLVFGAQHDGDLETYWEDLRVPLNTLNTHGLNAPDFELGKGSLAGFPLYLFDPDAEEEAFFVAQIPHSYRQGTTIYAHVHWVPDANAAAVDRCVKWGLEYTWANVGNVFPGTTIIYSDATDDSTQTVQDEQLALNTHYVSELSVDGVGAHGDPAIIDASEPKLVSSMLVCRLFRDATHADDDYTADAGLLEVDFHFEVDSLGSGFVTNQYLKDDDKAAESHTWSCSYITGDTITENSIDLRFHANQVLDIDTANRLRVTLFFIPAVRAAPDAL